MQVISLAIKIRAPMQHSALMEKTSGKRTE